MTLGMLLKVYKKGKWKWNTWVHYTMEAITEVNDIDKNHKRQASNTDVYNTLSNEM